MGIVKQLRMLLTLRAWLRSTQLQGGGLLVLLATAQTWLSSQDGIDLMAMLATLVHLMPATLGGVLLGVLGLASWILRAKTEWSLTEKVAGVDKLPAPNP